MSRATPASGPVNHGWTSTQTGQSDRCDNRPNSVVTVRQAALIHREEGSGKGLVVCRWSVSPRYRDIGSWWHLGTGACGVRRGITYRADMVRTPRLDRSRADVTVIQ